LLGSSETICETYLYLYEDIVQTIMRVIDELNLNVSDTKFVIYSKSTILNNLVHNKNIISFNLHRTYSTLNSNSSNEKEPKPVLILTNLNDKTSIDLHRMVLKDKSGIYCFVNTVNNKKYIGSAKDLYIKWRSDMRTKRITLCLVKLILKKH